MDYERNIVYTIGYLDEWLKRLGITAAEVKEMLLADYFRLIKNYVQNIIKHNLNLLMQEQCYRDKNNFGKLF